MALQLAALPTRALGQEVFGGVDGVTRDSASKQPLAQVRITAHNIGKGTDCTAISGSDGTFAIAKLEPGLYQVAAARDGFSGSTANVEVAAPETYRVDLLLAADYPPAPEAKPSAPAGAAPASAIAEELAALKDRIEQLEAALAGRPAPESASRPPAAAGAPAPQQAPAAGGAGAGAGAGPRQPSGSPASPRRHSRRGQLHAVRLRRLHLAQWHAAQQRHGAGYEILHPGSPVRHALHGGFQSTDRTTRMGGATESFRSGEFQVEQISVGGDFHWQNVRGRVLSMDGLFATTTPRNDASAGVGQWDLRDAYKYVSEAYGGYHFNVNHGLNVDAGIFVSYIGLFSYYNFDNWTYQPSYVSSNTPWFFNGLRIQWFPTNKLKIEPWIINGWQSYAKYNGHRGLGGQILYRPNEWLSLVFNNYGNGHG